MGILMYHDRNYSGTPSWQGTMAEYNALASHDPNTMYFITDETGSCILWKGTRAMFDALPDDEKNDNTLYIITDEEMTSSDIPYDNTESGLTATDVQAAIDEISQGGGGGGSAEETTYDNSSSGLDAENVQDAIDEVNDKFDGLPIPIQYKGTYGETGDVDSLPTPSVETKGYLYRCVSNIPYSYRYFSVDITAGRLQVMTISEYADSLHTELIDTSAEMNYDGREGHETNYKNILEILGGNYTDGKWHIKPLVNGFYNETSSEDWIINTTYIYNTGNYSINLHLQSSYPCKIGDYYLCDGVNWLLLSLSDETAEETAYDNSSSGLDAENVQDAIDEINDKFDGLSTPMQYKGTLGTGGTIQTLPKASADNSGFVYKVITETDYLLSTVYYKIRQYTSGTGYWACEATKAADENYTEIIKNQIFEPQSGAFVFYDFDNALSVGRSAIYGLIINSLIDGIHYNNNIYNTGDTIYSTSLSLQTVTGITYGASIHAKVGDIFISTGLEWTYIPSGDEANSFAELSDTNISNPTNGQVPIYNSTSGKWENGDSSGGTTDYEELSNLPAINGNTLFSDSTKETLGLEVELTQEEYDDLPSSKYSDDITYYITDSSNRSGETFVSLPVYAEWWTANTDSSTNTDYPYIYETSNIFQIDESDDTFFWTIDGADIFPTDNEKSAIKLVKEAVIDINNVPVGSFNLIRLYATGLPQVDLVFKMVRRY